MGCGIIQSLSDMNLTPTEYGKKPNVTSGNNKGEGINFGNAISVIEGLLALASLGSIPTPPVPPPTALLGEQRSGLSARRCAANIIARQSEAGAPMGVRSNGNVSIHERMEMIRVEEITREITQNARINVAIPPGAAVVATGANAGGPIIVYGATNIPSFGWGTVV